MHRPTAHALHLLKEVRTWPNACARTHSCVQSLCLAKYLCFTLIPWACASHSRSYRKFVLGQFLMLCTRSRVQSSCLANSSCFALAAAYKVCAWPNARALHLQLCRKFVLGQTLVLRTRSYCSIVQRCEVRNNAGYEKRSLQ